MAVTDVYPVTMVRRAMQDFTFSDGTFIPEGTFVGVAVLPTHHDEEYYEDPDTFNPWRFSALREKEADTSRYLLVSTSLEYHPFGHGRHAWCVFLWCPTHKPAAGLS
jgi:cytochrome P450